MMRICLECGASFNAKPYRAKLGEAKFCSMRCSAASRPGQIVLDGRIYLRRPDSQMAMCNGYVARARLILAGKIGRPLLRSEAAHHKDGNRANDSPGNLELMERGQHTAFHNLNGGAQRAAQARWSKQRNAPTSRSTRS